MQIAYNITNRNEKIRYIVIHDTGNTGINAGAYNHYKYFNSGEVGSSADIFVDDENILCINDYNKYYTWHCGDGKGKCGITNKNSIGIELCINSDSNYEKAFNNLVEITVKCAKELNIDSSCIVRHFDVSGKICPQSMSDNNWQRWKSFKEKVVQKLGDGFFDTQGHYAESYINKLKGEGIVTGDGNGYFKPDSYLTRADGAIMIAKLLSKLKDE